MWSGFVGIARHERVSVRAGDVLAVGATKRNLSGVVLDPVEITPLVASTRLHVAIDRASVLRDAQVLSAGLQRDLPVPDILDRDLHRILKRKASSNTRFAAKQW